MPTVMAEEVEALNNSKSSVKMALGKKTGNITYQIGGNFTDGARTGKAHFPLSELTWKIDINTARLFLNLDLFKHWSLQMEGEVNTSENVDILEDRDWLARNTLTGYSESNTSVSSREFLLATNRRIFSSENAGQRETFFQFVSVGLMYQVYDFRGFDTRQYSLSTGNIIQFYAGDIVKYELNQTALFASYSFSKRIGNLFDIHAKALYSPYSYIEDKDQHILAKKVLNSTSNGWLIALTLGLDWRLSQKFKLIYQIDYYRFESNGKQTQHAETVTGPETYQIEIKHLGEMTNYRLGFEYLL